MDTLLIGFIYVYVVLLAILDVGAFYFTYRIMKVVGAFRGWIIFLIFVVAFAAQGAIAFGISAALAIFEPSLLQKYLDTASASSVVSTGVYNLVLASLLFASMFELYRVFHRLTKERSGSSSESVSDARSSFS